MRVLQEAASSSLSAVTAGCRPRGRHADRSLSCSKRSLSVGTPVCPFCTVWDREEWTTKSGYRGEDTATGIQPSLLSCLYKIKLCKSVVEFSFMSIYSLCRCLFAVSTRLPLPPLEEAKGSCPRETVIYILYKRASPRHKRGPQPISFSVSPF